MVDKIAIFLPEQIFPVEKMEKITGGSDGIRGYSKNFRIIQRVSGISLYGSFSKYYTGENVIDLTRPVLGEALKQFEEETGLDLKQGIVFQIEAGQTLLVKRPPREYLSAWGTFGRYEKATWGNGDTVKLITRNLSFIGYDKGREIAPEPLPEVFEGFHALRLELEYQRGVKKLFGPLSPWDLVDRDIYYKLKNKWKEFYFRIPKERRVYVSMDGLTPAEMKDALAVAGINAIGLDNVTNFVTTGFKAGDIHKRNASRMREMINSMTTNERLTDVTELTDEVDELVRRV